MRFSYREIEKFFAQPLPGVNETTEALIRHAFEVEEIVSQANDWELDIKVLPDRASDAKSLLGMAREVSAVLNLPLKAEFVGLPTPDTARIQITFKAEDISHLLGVALGEHEISEYLKRVRVVVVHGTDDQLEALIPHERQDLNIKEDLADEVARLYGYENIPARNLKLDGREFAHSANFILANKVREHLVAEGYTEVYGYTFTDRGEVAVEKPLASDKAWLRTNLKDFMQRAIEFNLQYTLFDKDEVKLFEIGTVFQGGAEQINVVVGAGRKKPKLKIDVSEYKLADMADKLDDQPANLDPFIKADVHYQPVSSYPRILRDIAVWVPVATTPETVSGLIKDAAGELLVEGPVLFDRFEKGERQSLAFRLVLQSATKTLVDSEATAVMDKVISLLEKEANFEVRN